MTGSKTALVTGATSGLGRAMAQALLASGMQVAIAARPTPRLAEAVAGWQAQGLLAQAFPVDVRDEASVAAMARAIQERMGGLDFAVNNAGIGMRTVNPRFFEDPRPFYEVPSTSFDDVVRTNLTGYFLVAKALSAIFLKQGRGRLVNVTMNLSTMQRRGFVPYGPARAGAEALSRIMTEDLRPAGIWVNQLLPGGATLTGMIPEDAPHAGLLPAEIMGPPIVFLASAKADGLTGARIVASEFPAWLAAYRAGRTSQPPDIF
ncbi:MAG: SDR family NAD(P)-dependent oxidoreductase [Thermaerobacter sp.]|nr:SDR family NAD(P)-dependent oxidoreductase [Thermaerobacter sp.]